VSISASYRLWEFVDEKIGGLAPYLEQAREEGMTYRAIAADLTVRTGIDVSKSTVARWITDGR
jgi:intein-encoded DNA endonuclease-like protein